jgi:hypothetical protein
VRLEHRKRKKETEDEAAIVAEEEAETVDEKHTAGQAKRRRIKNKIMGMKT